MSRQTSPCLSSGDRQVAEPVAFVDPQDQEPPPGSETGSLRCQRTAMATKTRIQVKREEGRCRIVPDFPGDGAERHAGSRRSGRGPGRLAESCVGLGPVGYGLSSRHLGDSRRTDSEPISRSWLVSSSSTGRQPRGGERSVEDDPALAAELLGCRDRASRAGSRR